jgi:hypothetical protein
VSAAETLAGETCIRMQEMPQVETPKFIFDDWLAEGEELARRKKELIAGGCQLQFDIGDWLIRCENYKEGESITGYSASTLRTFVYVARHVPFFVRNASIPWGIHQLVAPLISDEDKVLFLQSAATGKWSVSYAKAVLKKGQANGRLTSSVVPKGAKDYTLQNVADRGVECGEDKDEMATFVSRERLQRTIDTMRRWKCYPIDDEDLSRAFPLLSDEQQGKVTRMLRKGAQILLNMAEKMEAVAAKSAD